MSAMGTMRDLDQIREQEDAGGSSRLMSLAMAGLATACVLFAVGVMVGRESGEAPQTGREDPLARLDQLAQQSGDVTQQQTWPERLTGPAQAATGTTPTAAPAVPGAAPATTPTAAMPTGTVVLGNVAAPTTLHLGGAPLSGTPVVGAAPSPAAPIIAMPAATGAAPVTAGNEGAFSLQVSSFRSVTAAQQFAARLRERGHHAFVAAPATAPNGAVWHRVRIGPFASQREASTYRATFEQRERMPTLVVRRDQEPFRAAAPQLAAAPARH